MEITQTKWPIKYRVKKFFPLVFFAVVSLQILKKDIKKDRKTTLHYSSDIVL